MESHFSSIHLHGSSKPALQETAGTCPGRFVQSFAQQRNPFSQWVSHWIHLCILSIQSCCQYKKWKHLSKESSSIQFALLKQTCSLDSLDCYSWLRATVWICFMPRVASPPVWMTLCCTDMQLDPRLLWLCTLPWWALRCFFASTVLQSQHIKWSLFFFFLVKLHKPRSTSAQ